MPWSADENRDFIKAQINRGDIVLDVGVGAGIWSDLLLNSVSRIDGVEIYEPYIARFDLRRKYRHLYIGDFLYLEIPLGTYTVLILGDVLEHFTPEDAIRVWDKARTIVGPNGKVLVSTPIIEWPQGSVDGNDHEAHLSFFTMEDLMTLPGVYKHQQGTQIGSVVAHGKESEKLSDLSVIIPTIPGREHYLARAKRSIDIQTLQPINIIVSVDNERLGAAGNRDKALYQVDTEYVAMLDDDDYFYYNHIETLYKSIKEYDADIVYSWFDVVGGEDPFPQNFGRPWNPEEPCQTTVTVMARTETLLKAGGYSNKFGFSDDKLHQFSQGNTAGEDFRIVYRANAQGAKIVHVPKRTWAYVHHAENTSGLPDRW